MVLHAILASGEVTAGWYAKIFCRKLFRSKVEAEAYLPEFKRKLCDQSYLECFHEDDVIRFSFPTFELDCLPYGPDGGR